MTQWTYKPASDIGLAYTQRLSSRDRESGLVETMIHQCVYRLTRFYLKKFQRLKVIHPERIPPSGPQLIVANHASHLDALALGSLLPKGFHDTVCPLAAGDVFFATPTRSLFSAFLLNALPMRRGSFTGVALRPLRKRLMEGALHLVLFPEGTRSRSGAMGAFKPGIGALVAATDIQVLPCWIEGAYESWSPYRKWPKCGRIKLHIGEPVSFENVANDRDGWQRIARSLQERVERLNPERTESSKDHDTSKGRNHAV